MPKLTDTRLVIRIVDRVEVEAEEITIRGSKATLANGLLHPADPKAAGVFSFVREWWRTQSGANCSPLKFPVEQGKDGEFSWFWVPKGR